MTIPESPIIQIERRKAIAFIASAVILAISIGGGLVKVGSGIASRSDNGIVVTGSARTEAVADNAVWTLSVSLSRPKVADAVSKVGSDVEAVTKYLIDGGISDEALTLGPVSTYGQEEWVNGNSTGRILNYRASRDITVRTKDVELVSKLSQSIGDILQSGVNVNNYGPQYYISTLAELRPQLLEEATRGGFVRMVSSESKTPVEVRDNHGTRARSRETVRNLYLADPSHDNAPEEARCPNLQGKQNLAE